MQYVIQKASKKSDLRRRLRKRLDTVVVRTFYQTCVRPTLEYSSLAFSGLSKTGGAQQEKTQRVAARLINGVSVRDRVSSELLLACAGLEPLLLRQKRGLVLMSYRLTRPEPCEPPHLISAYHL